MSTPQRKLFTKHHLSDTQLKFLSQICHNRQRNFRGPTLDVLLREDLIAKVSDRSYIATKRGREALTAARREGW